MDRLRRVFRQYSIASKVIKPGIRNFRQELDRGRILVVDDNSTYVNSHVMVVNPGNFPSVATTRCRGPRAVRTDSTSVQYS